MERAILLVMASGTDDGASREYEMPKNITAWWTRDTEAGAESKEYLVLHVSLQNEN